MNALADYGQILDLLEDCAIVRDMEGRVTGWNRVAEHVYGVPRELAIGKFIDDLLEDRASLPQADGYDEHSSTTDRAGVIVRTVRDGRGPMTMSVTSRYMSDAQGKPVAIIETSRPIAVFDDVVRAADLARLRAAEGITLLRADATATIQTLKSLRARVTDLREYLSAEPDVLRQLMLTMGVDSVDVPSQGDGTGPRLAPGATLASLLPEESAPAFIDAMMSLLLDDVPARVSCKLSRQDGKTYDAQITALRASSSAEGEYLLLSIRDVSAEREAFAAVEASEIRYRHLFDYMPIALTQVDASKLVELFTELRLQGVSDLSSYIDDHPEFMDAAMEAMVIEEVNQTNADLFGAASRDYMRGPITRYWSSGLPTLRKSLEARYRGQDFFQEEAKLTRIDGTIVDVLFAASRHSSLPNKSLVAFMDISDRKRAEQALRRSERRYQDLFQAMTVSFWELDLSDIHSTFSGVAPGADVDLAEYLQAKPDCVDRILASARIVDVNDQTMSLFGGAEKADLLKTLDHFWAPDQRADGAAAVLSVLRTDDSVTIETRLKRLTGEEFDAQFTLWFSTDDRRRGLAAVTDITERVNAFNALEHSEQRFRDLFQHLPVPVLQVNSSGLLDRFEDLKKQGVVDLKSHINENPDFLWTAMESTVIEQANDAAMRILGVSANGGLRGPITPLWRNHPEVYARLLENRYSDLEAYEEEVTLTTFDGQTREGTLTVTFPPSLAKMGVTINAFVDATEKKNAERRLRQIEGEYAHAARISMLGELTASIAHEVNQPLAAITTYGGAGLRWLNRPKPELAQLHDIMTRIVADAQRAAGVIARVRKMASHRKQDEEVVAMDELVAEAILFLGHEFRLHNVKVTHLPASRDTLVNVDRIQLQQVIVNLAVNALQAITTANCKRREILIRTIEEGTQMRCSVEDSGPGIAKETVSQIFESFFTTKDGGMGMGLPISRSIIEAHEGRMLVDNESALGGARFSFVLPKSQPEMTS